MKRALATTWLGLMTLGLGSGLVWIFYHLYCDYTELFWCYVGLIVVLVVTLWSWVELSENERS